MNKSVLKNILDFLHQAEKLKTVLRHCWLSTGRRESAAEHSWRLVLMAIVLEPHLKQKPDLLKTLKMVAIHDLCEVYAGDHWAFRPAQSNKHEVEERGLRKIVKNLPRETRKEIVSLWLEFEARKTSSAKFAYALDKLEVLLQHNEDDGLKHNSKEEFQFNLVCAPEDSMYDDLLKVFRGLIRNETLELYAKNRISKKLYTFPVKQS